MGGKQKSISSFVVTGTLAAPVTAMTDDWEINYDAVETYAQKLADEGLSGVFINGTLGEGVAMTLEERKRLTETWLKAAKGRLKYVVVHIGAANMHDSIELAKHAEKVGAAAISCVCPTYFKATSVEGLILYMKHVAAAAPTLPFYYYEIAQVTGNQISAEQFFESVGDDIPTLRGMKYSNFYIPTSYNVSQMKGGRYQVMTGTDEQWLAAASLGIEVNIVNGHIGKFAVKLVEALKAGDLKTARVQQDRLQKMRNLLFSRGADVGVAKAIASAAFGLDFGPARPPSVPLSQDVKDSFAKQLKDMGYFAWKKE